MMPTRPAHQATPPAATERPAWHRIPTAAARRFHQICVAENSEVVGKAGLTPLQYGAMFHLDRKTGSPGIEQNMLAARLNIDRNTASVLVEQMVRSGVAARQVNGADRRARLLSLTAKGERLFADLYPACTAVNAEILSPLAPREQEQFMRLLIRVIEGNLQPRTPASHRPARRPRPTATDN
jgi:DNA-binding MarR family transcriptional regulator